MLSINKNSFFFCIWFKLFNVKILMFVENIDLYKYIIGIKDL